MSEILDSGRSLDTFQRLGLLLDSEADVDIDVENGHDESIAFANGHKEESSKPKALIQIFTKPLFAEDTFFLEVFI